MIRMDEDNKNLVAELKEVNRNLRELVEKQGEMIKKLEESSNKNSIATWDQTIYTSLLSGMTLVIAISSLISSAFNDNIGHIISFVIVMIVAIFILIMIRRYGKKNKNCM